MLRSDRYIDQSDEYYNYDSWVDELTLRQKAQFQLKLTAEEEES